MPVLAGQAGLKPYPLFQVAAISLQAFAIAKYHEKNAGSRPRTPSTPPPPKPKDFMRKASHVVTQRKSNWTNCLQMNRI